MASLIQCTFPAYHHHITSVLSSSPTPKSSIALCFPRIGNSERLFVVNPSAFCNGRKFACNSGVSDTYASETKHHSKDHSNVSDANEASETEHSTAYRSEFQQSKAEAIAHSKFKLLKAVSGLKTGLAAGEEDVETVESAAKELESINGPVDLSKHLDKLQGKWKMIYSSAFSSPSRGTRVFRPFVRALPITVGQVFQRIDVSSKEFDNIAEVELCTPWLLPPLELVATFPYKFELTGISKIKIRSEKPAMIRVVGLSENLSLLEFPQIPDSVWPSSFIGMDDFSVTYIDSDTRITWSNMGDLRIYTIS